MNNKKSTHVFTLIFSILMLFFCSGQTWAQAPTVTTGPATDVTRLTATLNGTVNASGLSTTVVFEYGLDTGYGLIWTAVQSPLSGSSDTAVSAAVSELEANTTYHFRVRAQNSSGTTYGDDMTFTTAGDAASVLTLPASGVSVSGAILNGSVNARGVDTHVYFEYGPDTGYGTIAEISISPVSYNFTIAVNHTLSGLAADTLYHFRIKAVNVNGTVYGGDETFFTAADPAAPTVHTAPAADVGATSATLYGTVNPNGADTTVIFEYGLDTGYGFTAIAAQGLLKGNGDNAVNAVINDLVPNTTYHFRVSAQNSQGTTFGADMTFTTGSEGPQAVTRPATAISSTGATLNGSVNPDGASTAVTFEYGLDTSYGSIVTADQSPVNGSSDVAVSCNLTGLTDQTTYHFRVKAQSSAGTACGTDMTFTTGTDQPTAQTLPATGVTSSSATLNGVANARGSDATVIFEYGLDAGYGRTVNAVPVTVSGSTDTAVLAAVDQLDPGTTYHYRLKVTNSNGTKYGSDMTFITSGAPVAVTGDAVNVTTSGATLQGIVTAFDLPATVTFEYGQDQSYGTTVTADQSPVTGHTATVASKAVTGLSINTTYHFRVVARNTEGTTYGQDRTFYTSASTAPVAVTKAATLVVSDKAVLNGSVNAGNNLTTVTFEFGQTVAYGSVVSAIPNNVTGTADTPVSVPVTGLSANTTYHFRVLASNSSGTTSGADMTFFTGAYGAAATGAASSVADTSAVLNGIVNPDNSGDMAVYFQYGLTTSYGSLAEADPSRVSGNENVAVSKQVTDLLPNTTFHFRVYALVYVGVTPYFSIGEDRTFTTSAGTDPPVAVTGAATAVSTSAATLNGTVNGAGSDTAVTFEYGLTTAYGRSATALESPVSGSTDTAVSVTVADLAINSTYHFRVRAEGPGGTVYGDDMTFTTASAPPLAFTEEALSVTAGGATLRGQVNPQNDSTSVTFEYGLTTGYGSVMTAGESPLDGSSTLPVTAVLSGLAGDSTYHFRVRAENSSGTTYGTDMTFFTGAALPEAETLPATGVSATRAVLNGRVNAGNSTATVTFEYGETTAYGRSVNGIPPQVSGSTDTPVTAALTGLPPATLYHFRVRVDNAAGSGFGADMTFVTAALNAPAVVTGPIDNIRSTSARVSGEVVSAGGAPVTERGICWARDVNPTIAGNHSGSGSGSGLFSVNLTGLNAATEYYVRAYATNAFGTSYGDSLRLVTNSPSTPMVNTLPVTEITAQTAVCGGQVTENGGRPVTARGVCWSIAPLPTIENNRTLDGSGTGSFVSRLTGLASGTTCYVRAYATSDRGTAYGGEQVFTTLQAPQVSIVQPGVNEMVSGVVRIKADVGSVFPLKRMEFFVDNEKIGSGLPAGDLSMGPFGELGTARVLFTDSRNQLYRVDRSGGISDALSSTASVTALQPDLQGGIYLAKTDGLMRADTVSGSVRKVDCGPGKVITGYAASGFVQSDSQGRTFCLLADSSGRTWLKELSAQATEPLLIATEPVREWALNRRGDALFLLDSGKSRLLRGDRILDVTGRGGIPYAWVTAAGDGNFYAGSKSQVFLISRSGDIASAEYLCNANAGQQIISGVATNSRLFLLRGKDPDTELLSWDLQKKIMSRAFLPPGHVKKIQAMPGNRLFMAFEETGMNRTVFGFMQPRPEGYEWTVAGEFSAPCNDCTALLPVSTQESKNIRSYVIDWDTALNPPGDHLIRAEAEDNRNGTGWDQVKVNVPAIEISLAGEIRRERAWVIEKSYAALTIQVDNRNGIAVQSYAVLRRGSGSEFAEIYTFTDSDISAGFHTYNDADINTGDTLVYRVEARSAVGEVLAVSRDLNLE